MPSRAIKIENPSDIVILTTEITIRKNKILFPGIYKPPNLIKINFTTSLETSISKLSNKYEKLILTGKFNMTTSNSILGQLLDNFALLHLNADPTCFKNSSCPSYPSASCIDVLLT